MDAGEKGSEHESAGLISIVGDVSKLNRQHVHKPLGKADPARLSDIKTTRAIAYGRSCIADDWVL